MRNKARCSIDGDEAGVVYDEVTGKRLFNVINKTKVSSYELDEVFNSWSDDR